MADKPVLYGFDGSTYVRTVRMFLMENEIDYDQVHVNVLEGEPKQPEHLKRHPFGKVPVMDIDDMRLREADAICRYIDETGKGPSRVPDDPRARAKMNEAISVFGSYGYDALMSAAGYHLFPELVGGKNDDALSKSLADSQTLNALLMDWADPFICGKEPSMAAGPDDPLRIADAGGPQHYHRQAGAVVGADAGDREFQGDRARYGLIALGARLRSGWGRAVAKPPDGWRPNRRPRTCARHLETRASCGRPRPRPWGHGR
ncbi:glutathione S-transferase family protein [Roseovarius sp. B08]|uniref:glutathione S-transferase family protein n=1 Tax=Roseovarius sp. B08 TaxID=3449223 RepID=UPI003EDBE385